MYCFTDACTNKCPSPTTGKTSPHRFNVTSKRGYSTTANRPRKRGKGSNLNVPQVLPSSSPITPTIIHPVITYLPSLLGTSALALVPVLTIRWDINPVTFPDLFNPDLPGSLWHDLSPGLLNTINAAAQGHPGLIPIVTVHDMAQDPSFIVRTFKHPVIYMWTLKPQYWTEGCLQYIGQTINTRSRFGKNYNSPSYLTTHPSQFNRLLLKYGPQAFWVTIIAVTSPLAASWRPIETFFMAVFTTTLNSARISGSVIGVVNRVFSAQALAAKRVIALANLPRKSHVGENNPYWGSTHSSEIRNAISVANGTAIIAYELLADGTSVLIGTYNSATKASQALAAMGILVSRPTVLSYQRKGKVYGYLGRNVYFR